MARRPGPLAVLFLLSLLPASRAGAQQPLTLDSAMAAAVAHNPALAALRAQVDQAGAEVTMTSGARLPRLTLSERAQRGTPPVFAFGALLSARQFTAADLALDRLNDPGAISLFTSRIDLGQVIFDGGRTSAALAQARARRDVAQADVDIAAAGVMLDVTQTFGRLLAAQATARALDAGIVAATEDLARAERRRDAGTVTDADVLASAVHVSELRQRRLQLDADRATAAAHLNRLMGAAVDAAVEVAPLVPPAFVDRDLQALFAEADAQRPELRRSGATLRLANAGQRQASATWWPEVAAHAGVEWNGVDAGTRSRAWLIGAEARWTLSLSGADRARVAAAASGRRAAELAQQDARASVHVEVLAAVRQLEAATARVAVGAAAVAQAAERIRVVRNRYEAGLESMTDVLAGSSAHLDAQARHTSAIVDVLTATAALHRVLGRTTLTEGWQP